MILFTGRGGGGAAIPACIAGGIPACLAGFQAHTQGGSLGGSGPGSQQRGKLRGIWSRPKLREIWSRPTPKGEVEGDLARGGMLGGVPAPRGLLWGGACSGGACSRGVPALGWGVETPHDDYCCGRYTSYWNAFLFCFF